MSSKLLSFAAIGFAAAIFTAASSLRDSPGYSQRRPSAVEESLAPESKVMRKYLVESCKSCHIGNGKEVKKKGDYLQSGVLQKYIDRINPKNSVLYKKVASEEMPKDDFGDVLEDDDRKAFLKSIENWIVAGAPPLETVKPVDQVSLQSAIDSIDADLSKLTSGFVKGLLDSPKNYRYVTFLEIYNNPNKRKKLDLYRQALSKLLNSLSWNAKIAAPVAIDANKTVFRVYLPDYLWRSETWESIINVYPYSVDAISNSKAYQDLIEKTGTRVPIVRGDWLIDVASKPPLYHDILGMPNQFSELEGLLSVNTEDNYFSGRAARAGFIDSGVSQNNRIIERHSISFGAFWVSYDFAKNIGPKNIFQRPLGPTLSSRDSEIGAVAFERDGGEIIFNLPNGLQAYMLINAKGQRLDQGPIQIVSDPSRPDRLVTNGISCMGCHSQGMIIKGDQIFSRFSKNPGNSSKEFLGRVQELYGKPNFLDLMQSDRDRFLKASQVAGVEKSNLDPITEVVQGYDATLDATDFDAELKAAGISSDKIAELQKNNNAGADVDLETSAQQSVIGIKRDTFESDFAALGYAAYSSSLSAGSNNTGAPGSPDFDQVFGKEGSVLDFSNVDFSVGRIFRNIKIDDHPLVKIESVQRDGTFTLEFQEGKLARQTGSNWSKSDLAVVNGCSSNICVGQRFLNVPNPAAVTIVGIQPGGEFVLRFEEGKLQGKIGGNWDKKDLAILTGCHLGLCVGQQVINTERGARATIIAIQSGDLFVLRFDEGELQGQNGANWPKTSFALTQGCSPGTGICVGQKLRNKTRSNAAVTVVGIQPNAQFVLRFDSGDLSGKTGANWSASDLTSL